MGRLHGVSDKQGVISDHRGSRFKSRSVVTSTDMSSFPHQSDISVLASILPPPTPLLMAFQESILCRPSIVSGSESRGKFTICRSVDILVSTLGWAIVMVPATVCPCIGQLPVPSDYPFTHVHCAEIDKWLQFVR